MVEQVMQMTSRLPGCVCRSKQMGEQVMQMTSRTAWHTPEACVAAEQ